ncbi:3-deoxy-manno-octulosonate cytidylyltransferase [Candidatus Venteria ishoeyi]|uniref:3-deoxy-manno-octulosonate cytidylyltransferase n=1 Tax=Candidatus Venteria ishoeyi TaxID=1899563 RepID=A0A1H6FI69_9GAMM|nr:3-deoxy-manno-octulosonate cytidylyltransferase [Candidatus Venteria ishoeyi]SEH08826.1 3-deoxy-manno-octulosonate cytidylyltransferase [Candidatus Venteria ishoeyi]
MSFWVIIPARYGSSRLPGKPLLEIQGKPMLEHVYRCAQDSGAARVMIATDDQRIEDCAKGFGAEVFMTDVNHASGTDRVAEVARLTGADADTIIVNLQGDEPGMPASLIQQVAQGLEQQQQADMATLAEAISDERLLWNPNVVKLVRDKAGFALYFSRAPIPWVRDIFSHAPENSNKDQQIALAGQVKPLRHIGLYAYRNHYLQELTRLPACDLEQDEALEQLRLLYHGGKIFVDIATEEPQAGVDTAEDLQRWNESVET